MVTTETTPIVTTGSPIVDAALSLAVSDVWINDELYRVFAWVIIAVTCQIINIFGTVTNIINIICFIKQGIKDSVTISLLGLAISDLGCLTTLIFSDICYTPAFQDSDLPFDSPELQYLISGWPHVIFARITSWITALIALERCLCIAMPLKVKSLLTPQRVKTVVISIFILCMCMASPVYWVNSFGWKFSQERNRTILGLVFTPEREIVDKITFALNNIIMSYIPFIIVIVCTFSLVMNLRNKSQWREKSTIAGQAQATHSRDMKVAKMVVAMSTLFIVCYFPMCVVFICFIFIPGVTVDGMNRNTAFVIGFFGAVFESTNSAMNIFIYHAMSSKYRSVFQQVCRLCFRV